MRTWRYWLFILLSLSGIEAKAVEISGSPFDTRDAPLPHYLKSSGEKTILVDPREHLWGAYNAKGKLIRWGIATAGALQCRDSHQSCRTNVGVFRIYALGDAACYSHKYHGAAMPYCMFFNGSEAIHGSSEVEFSNISHGCVRIHIDDAKWLRYHFVESPKAANHFRGTRVVIRAYDPELAGPKQSKQSPAWIVYLIERAKLYSQS